MTTRDLIKLAGEHQLVLFLAFLAPPVIVELTRWLHGRDRGKFAPWKYLYTLLVYVACVPGMFAGVITAYTFFVTKENLLDANLLVYFAPIVSMIVTLILIRKNVSFDDVPGFERLFGLMIMLACSFAIALAVQKMKLFVFFGGSIDRLFLLAAGVFAILKWGTHLLFRRRDEPKQEAPKLPGT